MVGMSSLIWNVRYVNSRAAGLLAERSPEDYDVATNRENRFRDAMIIRNRVNASNVIDPDRSIVPVAERCQSRCPRNRHSAGQFCFAVHRLEEHAVVTPKRQCEPIHGVEAIHPPTTHVHVCRLRRDRRRATIHRH